jgi:hypothetical protein
MTLGYGLFTNFSLHSHLSKIIIYQIIAGIGTGPNFSAPLIALQSSLPPRDIATATATFGFTRTFSCAISVVVGGVIFQNELVRRGIKSTGTGGIFSSIGSIHSDDIKSLYAIALQRMWILYVITSAIGLATVFFIRKNTLSKEHKETMTGISQKDAPVEEKQEAGEETTPSS